VEKFLGGYSDHAYALMRIVVGLLFFCHGGQKVFGWFGGIDGKGGTTTLVSLLGVAGAIELIAGALIAAGLFAGYAAFIASGQMAVAYFTGHFPAGFWPLANQGDRAVFYCFAFLYIATRGAGIWSVDAARKVSDWRSNLSSR
jgi:putative oxidoreductase